VEPTPAPVAWPRRLFRVCASLRLALVLLSLFACCLAVATVVESAYGTRIAQELVYRTWWFTSLLTLLAVNVLCAALKKYPWKRHQTGFLITHSGLLVLVFGGLLTSLAGTEGQMLLIDTPDPEVQQRYHLANKADTLQLVDRHQLEVFRVPHNPRPDDPVLEALADVLDGGVEAAGELRKRLEGHFWSMDFSPGSLPWYADDFRPELPWSLRLLHALASPSPEFRRPLDDRTTLTVHNFYPHTEQWPFARTAESGPGFAALRVRLTTPMAGRPLDRWVTSLPAFERDPSPIALELMALAEPSLLPEFLRPPETKALGKHGQLVLAIGVGPLGRRSRKTCRLNLDELEAGRAVPLPGTDLKLTLKRYGEVTDLLGHEAEEGKQPDRASYPSVQFELAGPAGRGTYLCCARLPQMPAWQEGDEVAEVAGWYHYPDFRWGDRQKMGALQFLQGPGGTVYYRVYGKDGLRQEGQEIDATDPARQYAMPWQPMEMQLQLAGYLPHAARKPSVLPRNVRPGAEPTEPLEPALRCTLAVDGEGQEFWVSMSRQAARVHVGDRLYFVRYRTASRPAGFSLALKKAQQVTDPGTTRPASFQSDVVLTREEGGTPLSSEHSISMNNTLDHGRCKVYQTSYRPLVDPETLQLVLDREGKLVNVSGLTVASDPGLAFKYLGSVLLVLGIATMFWMRAYFFRPRPQTAPAAAS
jgi:hypothetical protein